MIPKAEIPDRELDCEEIQFPDAFRKMSLVIFKVRGWIWKGSPEGQFDDRYGKNLNEFWYTRTDGSGFDILSLGWLLDLVSVLIM